MPRGKKFTAEQIIGKLREAEVELSRGKKVPETCRKIGDSAHRAIVEPFFKTDRTDRGIMPSPVKRSSVPPCSRISLPISVWNSHAPSCRKDFEKIPFYGKRTATAVLPKKLKRFSSPLPRGVTP